MMDAVGDSERGIRVALTGLMDRLRPSEGTVMLVMAAAVGAGTGLAAVLFIRLIALTGQLLYVGLPTALGMHGRGLVALAPAIGGVFAGLIVAYFAAEAKGHGVPEVIQAIVLKGGRIRTRVAAAKIAASALCIGSGGSAGREGPIVQVGAAIGSSAGQALGLSSARIRNLVACGAAAGIAAAFNAPIAGVLFAMEIILAELHLPDLGNVVVSAVSGAIVARVFLGESPAFDVPRYSMQSPGEIVLFVVLGVLAAAAAVGFIRMLYGFEDLFDHWRAPLALKPAVGGLALGVLGFAYPLILAAGPLTAEQAGLGQPLSEHLPQVYGSGFATIEQALQGKLPFALLLALIFLKPFATSLTLGSGNSGGVFAPALFLGSALGGAFGQAAAMVMPGATESSGAYATVGMAAVFAGAARAPFTAIMIVFEMTDDYRLMLPLMAAVVTSYIVSERLHKESIYTLKLVRRGIRLQGGRDLDVMAAVRLDEVMVSDPMTVPSDLPLPLLVEEFVRTGRHGFPVMDDEGRLLGIVSLEDYRDAVARDPSAADHLVVGDIATRDVVVAFPDETVADALRRMAPRDLSRLPVVSRADKRRLLGVVRRNDIVRAYELGVVRREEARRRAAAASSLGDRPDVRFVDVPIVDGSRSAGRKVADLECPQAALLVSIRRGRDLVIPHGDTVLRVGDVVTALCPEDSAEAVRAALGRPADVT